MKIAVGLGWIVVGLALCILCGGLFAWLPNADVTEFWRGCLLVWTIIQLFIGLGMIVCGLIYLFAEEAS